MSGAAPVIVATNAIGMGIDGIDQLLPDGRLRSTGGRFPKLRAP